MHQEVSPTFFQATISQQLEKEHKKNNQISEECSCFVIINQILDIDRDLHNCILVINKTKTFFGPHDNFGVMFINQKNTDNTNNSAKKTTQKTRNAKKNTHTMVCQKEGLGCTINMAVCCIQLFQTSLSTVPFKIISPHKKNL